MMNVTKRIKPFNLKQFDSSCESLKENYANMVTKLNCFFKGQFADLNVKIIFKHLLTILDVST